MVNISYVNDVNEKGDKFKIEIDEENGSIKVYEQVFKFWSIVKDYSTICRVFYYHTKGGW